MSERSLCLITAVSLPVFSLESCCHLSYTGFKAEVCHFCTTSITKRNRKNNDCFQIGFMNTPNLPLVRQRAQLTPLVVSKNV